MQSYNFWLAMTQPLKDELWAFLWDGVAPVNFPLLGDISDETKEFFQAIYDVDTLARLFKPWNDGTNDWTLLSFYINKPENINIIASEVNTLAQAYNSDFTEIGLWQCSDGTQVGGNTTPTIPIPSLALSFMPDVTVDPGDPTAEPPVPPTYAPATELTQVNVLAGQADRDFTVSW